MNKRKWAILLAVFLGLALVGALLWSTAPGMAQEAPPPDASLATARYVAFTGNDEGNCTVKTTPCKTLQYAVDQSLAGDEIRVATGVYTGVQTRGGMVQMVIITRTLTVLGGYKTDFSARDPQVYSTTLDAETKGRLITVQGVVSVTLDGLRMVNGAAQWDYTKWPAGGAVYGSDANLRINDCRIENSTTTNGEGNGLYVVRSSLWMSDSLVQGNHSTTDWADYGQGGGGVFAESSKVEIYNSLILSNTAANAGVHNNAWGGGIALRFSDSLIQGVTLRGNLAANGQKGAGGGLWARYGTLELRNSILENNTAALTSEGSGGAVVVTQIQKVLIDGNVIRNNAALSSNGHGSGGALLINSDLVITVTNNLIQGNVCPGGGCFGGGFSIGSNKEYVLLVSWNLQVADTRATDL